MKIWEKMKLFFSHRTNLRVNYLIANQGDELQGEDEPGRLRLLVRSILN